MELSLTINDVTVSQSMHGLEDEITVNSLIISLVHLASSMGLQSGSSILFTEQQDGMRLIECINNYMAEALEYVTEEDIAMITDTLKTKLITE